MWNWASFNRRCASALLHTVIKHSFGRIVGTYTCYCGLFFYCVQTFNLLSRSFCMLVLSSHLLVAVLLSALAESLLIAGFSSEIPDTERHQRSMLILEPSWSKKEKKEKAFGNLKLILTWAPRSSKTSQLWDWQMLYHCDNSSISRL